MEEAQEGMTDALEGENPGGVAEEETEAAGNVSSWADEMVKTFLVQRTACSSPPSSRPSGSPSEGVCPFFELCPHAS
jgi:hypothetical protein